MGTKFATVYATLTIGYIEIKLYKKVAEVFMNEFGQNFLTNWIRFLDDNFVPWTKSVHEFESYIPF